MTRRGFLARAGAALAALAALAVLPLEGTAPLRAACSLPLNRAELDALRARVEAALAPLGWRVRYVGYRYDLFWERELADVWIVARKRVDEFEEDLTVALIWSDAVARSEGATGVLTMQIAGVEEDAIQERREKERVP